VAAILPLYEAIPPRPLRLLRFVGHGPADQLGPVCAPEDRRLAAEGLARAARGPGDLLLAERLDGEAQWAHRLAMPVVRHEPSPRVEIAAPSWEDYLAGRSAHFRQSVRRGERKLRREHGLSFRLSDGPHLDADLDSLFHLHELRWQGAATRFGKQRAFHRDFAAVALDRGWLRLWLAEIAGRPVAAWYGFRFAGADWHYQNGRDPRWNREGIGFVLLAHTIREAVDDGMREYKMLLGGESYKDRFATSNPGLQTLVLGSRLAGTAAARATAAAARLSPTARRRLVAVSARLGIGR
jgi:CelD/BcsL family acetyltransferase involved in cellulose biosynthesis